MATPEDPLFGEMLRTVRELTQKLDDHTHAGDVAREALKQSIEGTVAAMRDDFWKTTIKIQRDAVQHRDEHTVERTERTNRQFILNLWLGALTALVVVNLILLVIVAVRVVSLWLG